MEFVHRVDFEAKNFTFQPTDLRIWDVDNQATCGEGVALFGMLDGDLVNPATRIPGPRLMVQNYTVPEAAMLEIGLPLGDSIVPGAQMQSTSTNFSCPTDSIAECTMIAQFNQPIDTLVYVYGMASFNLPGSCGGSTFLVNPTLRCPLEPEGSLEPSTSPDQI